MRTTNIMRAARRGERGFEVSSSVPKPNPEAGDAVVRITHAALCSVDVLAVGGVSAVGGAIPFRGIPGHMAVGVVEHIEPGGLGFGPGEARRWERKRVVFTPVVSCGTCDTCRAGLSWHCPSRMILGLIGLDGTLAQYVNVPMRNLVAVPDALDDARAAFAPLVGAAIQATSAIRVEGKTFVTVLGDGPMGICVAQALVKRNAAVRLLGRTESRFGMVERWGIKHRHESEAGRRADQDVVVDCTGHAGGFSLACRLVRPKGTIILKGPPVPLAKEGLMPADLLPASSNEVTIHTVCSSSVSHGIDAMHSGLIDITPMLDRPVPLAQTATVLERIARRTTMLGLVQI